MLYNDDGRRMVIDAPSLDDCKSKLFKKYGNNWHISNWERIVKDGFWGIGTKELIRAYYTVNRGMPGDDTEPYNDRMQAARANSSAFSPYGGGSPRSTGSASPKAESFDSSKEDLLKNLASNVSTFKQLGKMQTQLDGIESILAQLKDLSSGKQVHGSIKKIDAMLEKNEFTKAYIEDMNSKISSEMSVDDLEDFDLLQNNVVDWIGESIRIAPKYPVKSTKLSHTIIIVGPTGVGKTTTVAKMAATIIKTAKKQKQEQPRVLMITTDKERVAAKEQLEHYAEVMEVEFCEASTPEDFEDLYNSYKTKKDFIFVDTSGYSPRDLESIGRLHKLLDVDGLKADVYLAVSASTKASDLRNILKNYDSFNYRSVIITKCDETLSYGNVLSVLAEKKKPISLVTYGQKTLNTMQRAHPYYFLKSLLEFNVDKEKALEKFGPEDESGDE